MLGKYKMLLLGAMLGVGTLAFSGAGLAAVGMFPAAPLGPAGLLPVSRTLS